MISEREEIINRVTLYNSVNESNNKDSFLEDVATLLPNPKLNASYIAKGKMLSDKYLKKCCEYLISKNVDSMVGGSGPLSVVHKAAKFKPADLDLYVKNIDVNKIKIIDDMVHSVFQEYGVIIIRNIITVTWIIYDKSNFTLIYQVQVNLLKMSSWSEFLVTCHSDIVTVIYDILSEKFLFMKGRFDKMLKQNKHYFSNILNCDTETSLTNAVNKYKERNFDSIKLYVPDIETSESKLNISETDGNSRHRHRYSPSAIHYDKDLISQLKEKYAGIVNIVYSTSIHEIYDADDDKIIPPVKQMWKLKENDHKLFYDKPTKLVKHAKLCPQITAHCGHTMTLHRMISVYNVYTVCETCRNVFNPLSKPW